ncbi:single-stranded DNA-binding protein [bacterium]|nr:single-stranded DNA-binding protein [bacterium]
MINHVVLVGRLARDPFELRRSQTTGNAAISFTLAVDNRFASSQQGEENKADFIPCVAFNKLAEFVEQYLKKGMLVGLEGRVRTRNYEDRNGNRVYVTEISAYNIQILESKSAQENRDSFGREDEKQELSSPNEYEESIDISEDDLPF